VRVCVCVCVCPQEQEQPFYGHYTSKPLLAGTPR